MSRSNITMTIINQDEISFYLKDVRRIPVLSEEEQKLLVEQIRIQRKAKNVIELKKLEKKIVEANLRFVISIAKEYQGKGMDLCDLIAEGNIGLLSAFERFDPSKEVKFISYAVHWIRQAIRQAMYDTGRTIRLPVNIAQDVNKKLNKQPTTESEQDLMFVMEEINPANVPFCVNLDDSLDGDGNTLLDIIENKNAERPDEAFNNKDDMRQHVQSVLKVLDERERNIIEDYFGIHTGTTRTLEEIGEEFGLTKERVRQIKDKALKKLRNESESLFQYL